MQPDGEAPHSVLLNGRLKNKIVFHIDYLSKYNHTPNMFPIAIQLESKIGQITNMDVEVFMRLNSAYTFIIPGDQVENLKPFEDKLRAELKDLEITYDADCEETFGFFSI